MPIEAVFAVGMIVIGLPWIVLHYITKWKTAATITQDDEALLDDLYSLAKRLDERMDTVERLAASNDPDFDAPRLSDQHSEDTRKLRELDQLLAEKKAGVKR